MTRRLVERVVAKDHSVFIFRVQLVPDDTDTHIPRNIRKIPEHLHFHQYHCEGRQITDDKVIVRRRFTGFLRRF